MEKKIKHKGETVLYDGKGCGVERGIKKCPDQIGIYDTEIMKKLQEAGIIIFKEIK